MVRCNDPLAWETTATAGTAADTTYLTSSIAALSLLNRMRFWNTSLGVLDSMKVGSYAFRVHYNSALLPDTLTEPSALKRWDTYTTTYSLYSRDYPTGLDSVFARRFAYDSLGRIVTDQKVNGYSSGWIWGLKNYAYTGTGALRWYQIAHTQNRSCDPNYGCTFAGTTVDTTYGYQYDAVNNLTQEADSTPCCVTNGTFSTGNRLTAWGSTSYTYDTDGHRATKGGGTTYTWSATGKLVKVANGSNTVEFAYNALGQLARRKTNGTIDRYYSVGPRPAALRARRLGEPALGLQLSAERRAAGGDAGVDRGVGVVLHDGRAGERDRAHGRQRGAAAAVLRAVGGDVAERVRA